MDLNGPHNSYNDSYLGLFRVASIQLENCDSDWFQYFDVAWELSAKENVNPPIESHFIAWNWEL